MSTTGAKGRAEEGQAQLAAVGVAADDEIPVVGTEQVLRVGIVIEHDPDGVAARRGAPEGDRRLAHAGPQIADADELKGAALQHEGVAVVVQDRDVRGLEESAGFVEGAVAAARARPRTAVVVAKARQRGDGGGEAVENGGKRRALPEGRW